MQCEQAAVQQLGGRGTRREETPAAAPCAEAHTCGGSWRLSSAFSPFLPAADASGRDPEPGLLLLLFVCDCVHRYVAIGSKTVQGKAWLNNTVQDFAYQSYNICCGKGEVWGDGVTPLECALGECRVAARCTWCCPECGALAANSPPPAVMLCCAAQRWKVLNTL